MRYIVLMVYLVGLTHVERRKKNFSPGASVHISGLHLYAFLSPNLNFYACRSKMLNVTLIHRTKAMCLDIVSTRKRSRLGLVSDTRGSRLGLVSDSLANVSVSSRSRELRSRSWSRSRPRRSWAHPCKTVTNFGSYWHDVMTTQRWHFLLLFVEFHLEIVFCWIFRVVGYTLSPINKLFMLWVLGWSNRVG